MLIRVCDTMRPRSALRTTFLPTGQPRARARRAPSHQGTRWVTAANRPSPSPTTTAKSTMPKSAPANVSAFRPRRPAWSTSAAAPPLGFGGSLGAGER